MSNIDKVDLTKLEDEELKDLIKRVEKEQDDRSEQHFEKVKNDIKASAASIGMTPEEVVMRIQRGGKGRMTRKALQNIRYRNPKNPMETWTGRGKRPNWLVKKLEDGAKLEDFKI